MQPGSVDVWLADVDTVGPTLDELEARLMLLPERERFRAAGMTHVADAQRWIRARIALRLVLATHVGIGAARTPFALSPHGKPHLNSADLQFSISHSGARLLVAVSREGPVGVDVETRATVDMSEHRRSAIERAAAALVPSTALPTQTGVSRFLQAWVRLEALAKATGTGIGAVLEHAMRQPPACVESWADAMLSVEGRRLRLEDLTLPAASAAAVALPLDTALTLRTFLASTPDELAALAERRG